MDYLNDFGQCFYDFVIGTDFWWRVIITLCVAIWLFGGESTTEQEQQPYYTPYEVVG